jgi:hypothetical protein
MKPRSIATNYFILFIIGALSTSMPKISAETIEAPSYSIISENQSKDVKRSVDVRLEKKVSAEVLKTIAEKIKGTERKKFERTFITYYLPEMKVGSGAWATSHFDPDLKVKIIGLTADEEDKLTNDAKSTSRDVVGIWLDTRPAVSATITIFRENKKLFLEWKFKDGSRSSEEMTESKSTFGTRLVQTKGNSHGEYFELDQKGNLQAGGKNGIFLKYQKLK